MKHLRLGTRKSALAQTQANWVADRLREAHRDLMIDTVLITTQGDEPGSHAGVKRIEDDNTPRHGLSGKTRGQGGLKAMFTKEIEDALLANEIDFAVHSLKDMASVLPAGLMLASVPVREDARDVWIGRRGTSFKDLRVGATVATGAIRRQAQLRHMQPELEFVSIRGNVDTRLSKLREDGYDGMVLALAGLKRLGREVEVTDILSLDVMLPAVGQGALGIEIREGDADTLNLVKAVDDPVSHVAVRAERAFLKELGGSCQTPIAGYAEVTGNRLMLRGLVVDPSGAPFLHYREESIGKDPETIGHYVAQMLLARGADKLLS
jgi:hydroxymethylbilane synthase